MYNYAPNMCITRLPVGAGNPFTVISNDVTSYSRDDRLSSSAKGILLTVFALPDKSWHFSVEGLSLLMKDSEDKIRSTLKELKKFGYYVTEKIKGEKGRYQPAKHYFYESVQLNANEDADKENGLFSSPCPRRENPHVDSPDVVLASQSNTNISNTNSLSTKSVCLPGAGTTDGQTGNVFNSKENHSDTVQQITEIKELEIMFAEATGFAEEVKQYLAEMISTGRISSKKTVDAEELLQKLWAVYTENELPVFLEKLEAECTESLKKLKYVKARDSYLKSVIAEFTLKYTSQNSADKKDKPKKERSETEHSEPVKPLGFREMLKEMQYPDTYDLDSEIFDSEDEYHDCFGGEDEEELKMCIIPDSFRDNHETMERALKFLGRYHWICSDEYRTFADETYRSLARIICTGRAGRKTVDAGMLIRRLNEINADRYGTDDSIHEFVQSFRTHFKSKSAEYSDVTNKKAYREAMLVSFLDGEYQETNLMIQHRIAMMEKHLAEAEEKRRKEKEQHEEWVNWMKENNFDLSAEETSAEPETAVEKSNQIVPAVEESVPQESADTVTEIAETVSDGNQTEETEEAIQVAEDITAPAAEETAEKTESVCPADKHVYQKSGAVSENGDFIITDEMRNRVLNALYGENKEEICSFTKDTTAEIIEPATTVPEVEERKVIPIPAAFRCTGSYQNIIFA